MRGRFRPKPLNAPCIQTPLQDDDLAVEFVTAASALRSFNYGIPTQSVRRLHARMRGRCIT